MLQGEIILMEEESDIIREIEKVIEVDGSNSLQESNSKKDQASQEVILVVNTESEEELSEG